MDMIGRIRRLHSRKNKSQRDIARITGLSRNTVAKWLHGQVDGRPKYRRSEQPNKLTAFHDALEQALKADARRPKHERRTAKALYAEIRCAGYDGGYTRVTDFIRAWRQGEGQAASVNAFIPLTFELGEAYQFDWSEEGLVVGGIYYRAQVSHMKLCASRAFWLAAYPSQGHEMLFDAHTRSFAALGGVARRGIYDNMKTAVDKVKKGKGRVVNERFATMCAHYLVDPDLQQRRQRLGEGRRREERAGQPPAHLDRCGQGQVRQLHRTQRLAGRSVPGLVAGGAPSRARAVQRGRDARARALAPDAHAHAVRRLRREAGAGGQHLRGIGGAQPLLGAVRAVLADRQHAAVPGQRRRRGAGQGGRPSRSPEQRRRDAL